MSKTSHSHDHLSSEYLTELLLALTNPLRPSISGIRTHNVQTPLMASAEIPEDVKAMASELKLAVRRALSKGEYLLEVTLPRGLCIFKSIGKQTLGNPDLKIPEEYCLQGDRDCAYLCCELFANLGEDVACVLPEESLADAEREWKQAGLQTRLVTSISGVSGQGFGSKKPPKVLVLTRADKEMLQELNAKNSDKERIVILANPKQLKSGKGRKGFESAFFLKDNPHPDWRGGMMYRSYPGQWLLATSGQDGRSYVHGRQDERVTLDKIDAAFTKIKSEDSLQAKAGSFFGAAPVGSMAALERKAGGD